MSFFSSRKDSLILAGLLGLFSITTFPHASGAPLSNAEKKRVIQINSAISCYKNIKLVGLSVLADIEDRLDRSVPHINLIKLYTEIFNIRTEAGLHQYLIILLNNALFSIELPQTASIDTETGNYHFTVKGQGNSESYLDLKRNPATGFYVDHRINYIEMPPEGDFLKNDPLKIRAHISDEDGVLLSMNLAAQEIDHHWAEFKRSDFEREIIEFAKSSEKNRGVALGFLRVLIEEGLLSKECLTVNNSFMRNTMYKIVDRLGVIRKRIEDRAVFL